SLDQWPRHVLEQKLRLTVAKQRGACVLLRGRRRRDDGCRHHRHHHQQLDGRGERRVHRRSLTIVPAERAMKALLLLVLAEGLLPPAAARLAFRLLSLVVARRRDGYGFGGRSGFGYGRLGLSFRGLGI